MLLHSDFYFQNPPTPIKLGNKKEGISYVVTACDNIVISLNALLHTYSLFVNFECNKLSDSVTHYWKVHLKLYLLCLLKKHLLDDWLIDIANAMLPYHTR